MSERLEQATWPPEHIRKMEEGAMLEANILQKKIAAGDAATYTEAEQVLAREEFQKKLEQKAKDRNQLRPKWKKWLGISKADPKAIEMERAQRENEQINSLIVSGKVKNIANAIEYLHRMESSVTSSPEEWDLEQRELARSGKLLGGQIGGATFVELKDDGSAVYKPHDTYDEKSRKEFINRERAAYLIDRFLGFNFVPPTVVRELDKGVGSLQEFIADAKVGHETKRNAVSGEEHVKLRLFDALILNSDRHGGNYLVKNGKIYAIDHGYTLPLEHLNSTMNLADLDIISQIPTELRAGLERFAQWQEGQELLEDALTELFDEKYARAIMKRIRLFLAAIDEQGKFSKRQFYEGIETSRAELCPT